MDKRFVGRTDLETLAGVPDVEAIRQLSRAEGYRAGRLKAAEIAASFANNCNYSDKCLVHERIAAAIRAAEKEE